MIDARHWTYRNLCDDARERACVPVGNLDLRGADLRPTPPPGAGCIPFPTHPHFVDCDLRGADFRGAALHMVRFDNCRMEGVIRDDRWPRQDPGYIREIVKGRSGVEWVRCYRTKGSTHAPYPLTYEYGDLVEAFPWLECGAAGCGPGIGVWYTWSFAHSWARGLRSRFRNEVIEVWTFAHLIHDVALKSRAAWVIVGKEVDEA